MDDTIRIKERLQGKAARAGVPISGTFELTPRCNLQCRMCYVRMTESEMKPHGRELTAKEWIALGEEAAEAGMLFLLLTGGEPMLRPDFSQIYEAMSQLGLSVSMNTNGSILSEKMRSVLVKRPPAQLNVTLYGPNEDTYASLCGSAQAFRNTMDTLRWARDSGILLNVNTTVTPWNVDLIAEMEELAERENFRLRLTFYNFPPSRREQKAEFCRLPPEEVGCSIARREFRLDGAKKLAMRAKFVSKAEQLPSDCQHLGNPEGDPVRCFAGRSQFWINWNGKMTPCGMLDIPEAAPLQEGFLPAWEKIREETARIRLCADCATCKDRHTCFNCPAVMWTETGSYRGRPDYMCRLNRAYREEILTLADKLNPTKV